MYETYLQNEREFEKIGIFSAPIPQSPDGLMTFVADISAVKSHNRQTMLKLVEEIQKNMPSHDAVQKILFDIQSYLTKEQVLSELLKK